MQSILKYYRPLILGFYLVWYAYIVALYFEPDYQIWLNAFVIAIVVGIALNLSATASKKSIWLTLRFFIIPFAVSSYTALIRDKNFFIIFPSDVWEVIRGLLICLLLIFIYYLILCRKI